MSTILPLVMFAVAGMLAGGAFSVHRQSGSRALVGALGMLAVLALAGGIAWLWPGGE